DVAAWQRDLADKIRVVPISGGALEPNAAKAKQHGLKELMLQAGRETSQAFKVTSTPSAVVVRDGKIATPLAEGPDAIRSLVKKAAIPPPAKKGEPVPEIKLADLKGREVDLGSLRGRRRLVLFWNPGCGFCQAMLDDVKNWEKAPPRDAPEAVIVSSGSA